MKSVWEQSRIWRRKKRKHILGGMAKNLLENLISSFNGKRYPIRSFSAEELKIATNNHDLQSVIIKGFVYELYNALLHGRPVSVMKFQKNHEYDAYEWCLKNIAFAPQMSHKRYLNVDSMLLRDSNYHSSF